MTEAISYDQVAADLPLEVTSFVGRRFDRARVRELMSSGRLVTLTGFGGVGKTRLALRVASDVRRAFESVHVVTLASVSDPDDVPDQIAAALGLHGRTRQSAMIAVVEYLKARTVLLVLDNGEHVIDVLARVSDTLLRTCPGVHLLVTSREPLRIEGEVEYAVSPLTFPGTSSDEAPLRQYEAVQLFLDRARGILPDFELTDDNRAALAGISRKLEGFPLAIELAAARLRAFSPAELEAQLTSAWGFLGRGGRTSSYRHSSMAACIDWSFDLCTPAERRLWASASVFVDGFELDAALAVCSGPGIEEPVEESLAALVEKSVVTTVRSEGLHRYRMLPPIRHRGLVELAAHDGDAQVRRQHKDYFLDLVARAHDAWFGPSQLAWLDRLRRERENISQALELCVSQPEFADEGLRAGANIMNFGLMEGRFRQGRLWFERILAVPGDPEARALALRTAGMWAAAQGDHEAAARLLEEGQVIANRLDGVAKHLLTHAAGFAALFAADPARAERLLTEAIRGLADSDRKAEVASCYLLLALSRTRLGDPDGALAHHRTCLALTEATGETWLRAVSLWVAALALWQKGEPDAARELACQSLRLRRQIGEPVGIATMLETLAWFAASTDPMLAATLQGAAQNEWDKLDVSTRVMPGLGGPHEETIAFARAELGDDSFERAWSYGRALDQATAIARALGEQSARPVENSPTRSADGGRSVLTRRELQIADLIHQGLSNREIADTLVISPRTAESHVQKILTKLGFTRRTQVASWFGDLQRDAQ